MTQYIKILMIYILRILLRLFYIIPINEHKIIFVSWMGRQYACNPKYIFEYMYKLYSDQYVYVWSLKKKKMLPADYKTIQVCGYFTLKYIYVMMTAKYIITNHAVEPCFPFRKNQRVIYTWHGGGAYKKVGDIEIHSRQKWSKLVMRDIRSKMVSYVISSCEKFTEVHSGIWNIAQDIFLPIGMPRNDILFFSDNRIKNKVYKYYNLNAEKRIVLYAPTYRGNNYLQPTLVRPFDDLDIEEILESLKIKYGNDFLFLYRTYYTINIKEYNTPNIILASDYPDMQELLYVADILITDYSSSIWDFSFTFKPCFIYAPDMEKYQGERGFFTPIEEWPFPLAKTSQELIANIIAFDEEKYKQAVRMHHADLGSYETGTACNQFCDSVFSAAH